MVRVILKRQANYTRKTWLHPLRGISTLRAEAAMIKRLRARGVAVPELIYYGESDGSERRAALMATKLACSESLDRFASMLYLQQAPLSKKRKMIFAAAQAVRKMHLARCQHRALFPKHLLVCGGDPLQVCIIDLEKSRLRLSVHQCMVHDLDTLNRRSHGFMPKRSNALLQTLSQCEQTRHARKNSMALDRETRTAQTEPINRGS